MLRIMLNLQEFDLKEHFMYLELLLENEIQLLELALNCINNDQSLKILHEKCYIPNGYFQAIYKIN